MKTVKYICIVGLSAIIISGCSLKNVEPWERGTLSTPAMEFGYYPVDDAIDDHLYFSKEATSGGRGFGGGGCGCN